MPGGDGTGPRGMGPMTGRGAGFCAGYSTGGYANTVFGRYVGFGFGRARGCGLGRGFGRGLGWYEAFADGYYGNQYLREITPKQEAEALKKQAKVMQDEINAINEHIKELEIGAKENK